MGRALSRVLLAALLALGATAAAFGLVAVVGAVAGDWPRSVASEQVVGLALHAGVVFARGVLPCLLATALLAAGAARLGRPPGLALLAGLGLLSALVVVPVLLTSAIGDWPRLQIDGAPDAVATTVLLALASAGALRLAERWAPRG